MPMDSSLSLAYSSLLAPASPWIFASLPLSLRISTSPSSSSSKDSISPRHSSSASSSIPMLFSSSCVSSYSLFAYESAPYSARESAQLDSASTSELISVEECSSPASALASLMAFRNAVSYFLLILTLRSISLFKRQQCATSSNTVYPYFSSNYSCYLLVSVTSGCTNRQYSESRNAWSD